MVLHTPVISQTQNNNPDTSLITLLETIESSFDVVFTFRDQDIADIKIYEPANLKSLGDFLKAIETQTNLRFKVLNKRYISIRAIEDREQLYCGVLIDYTTNQVIPYASISYLKTTTESDSLGRFALKYNGNKKNFLISHINYQTTGFEILDMRADDCDTIYLEPKISLLGEVLIPDYVITGLDKLDGGVLKFTSEDLPVLPGLSEPDVFFSMQSLPGIHSSRESVSDINIRGGRNDQNLILWNGIRMYQTGHFFGLISLFNPYFIDQVILTKNGTAPKYGNSVSGVVDLQTSSQVAQEFSGQTGANMLGTDLNLHLPINTKTSVHLSGRRSLSNLLITPTYKRYFNRAFRNTEILDNNLLSSNEDFNFSDIAFTVNRRFNKRGKLQLSFLNATNELTHLEQEVLRGTPQERESSLQQKNRAAGIRFESQFTEKSSYHTGISFSGYSQKSSNQDISKDQTLKQINDVLDIGFYLRFHTSLGRGFDLSAGYEFNEVAAENEEKLNRPGFNQSIKEVLISNVFQSKLQYTSPTSKFTTRAGLRGTHYGLFNQFYLEPRVTFNYQLNKSLSMEVLAEKKHQSVSQIIDLQTDFLGVIKSRWVLANNLDIPISESSQLSLGAQFNSEDLMIGIDLYIRKVAGIITSGEGFRNQFEFVRAAGKQEVIGLEFLLNKRFSRLNSWLSYAVLQNTNNFSSLLNEDFPSNQNIVHQLTVGAGYKSERLEFSTGVNINTGGPFTEPILLLPVANRSINYQSPNSSRLATYLRLDFSARYRLYILKGLRTYVGASVWNLTASKNELERYFRLDDTLDLVETSGFALKFTPNLMMRIEF